MTRPFSILLVLPALTAAAQQPLILLDPARGGADSGAHIADRLPEKQVTLDLAGRLASLLRARGFAVEMTREADVDVPSDSRAALANNTHPLACLLLYAAPAGGGVHLYTTAQRESGPVGNAVQWDKAQAAYAEQSRALAGDLRAALDRARVKASAGQTWMRPLDNMQCPAVAIEVLPESKSTAPDDSTYQSHIANAVANTLLQWRARVAAMHPSAPAPVMQPVVPQPHAAPTPEGTATKPGAADGAEPVPVKPGAVVPAPSPSSQSTPAKPAAARQPPATGTTGAEAGSADTLPRRTPRLTQPAPIVRQPALVPDRTEP